MVDFEKVHTVGDTVWLKATVVGHDPGTMTKELVDGEPTDKHGKFLHPLVKLELDGVAITQNKITVPERIVISNVFTKEPTPAPALTPPVESQV